MIEKSKPTLVILAAGMGRRYGGLKQIDTFTPEGDTIIDFSIYDAIIAGFGKVIFVIRKAIKSEFNTIFNTKLSGKIEVEYVFQELDNVPEKYSNPNRKKPWGTGHALLMIKNNIKENFAIINADDFYGRQAFITMADQLNKTATDSYKFNMIAYALKNTVSDNGYVSRGECTVDSKGSLINITERIRIEKINGILKCDDGNGVHTTIDPNSIISMNFWGFTPKVLECVDALFLEFLEQNKTNLEAEFYLPNIVNAILANKIATVKVLKTKSKWFGVTYSRDKEKVKSALIKLKAKGVYPEKLWK